MVYGGNAVNYTVTMDISQAELQERFDYNPLTGQLSWSQSKVVWAAARGKEITHVGSDGYIELTLTFNGERKSYYAHRVIWKLVTGQEPPTVDHKNRKRADNRLVNLRGASCLENANNRTGNLFCEKWRKYMSALYDMQVSYGAQSP